jgi:phosphinothricin acetyltransferase
MRAPELTIRPGEAGDLEPLNDLYNHYIATSPATFDVDAWPIGRRRDWFTHYGTSGRYRLLVATEGPRVLGFTTSSPVRPKQAYDTSIETTVYVAPDATGRGVGSALYASLFEAVAGEDLHRAFAGITQPNPASVALHERFGFTRAGLSTEQGRKFGRYWDVAWFEKPLGEPLRGGMHTIFVA